MLRWRTRQQSVWTLDQRDAASTRTLRTRKRTRTTAHLCPVPPCHASSTHAGAQDKNGRASHADTACLHAFFCVLRVRVRLHTGRGADDRDGFEQRGAASGKGAAGGNTSGEEEDVFDQKMAGLKVAVAVDASEESLHALSWALDNVVHPHPDAALVVVHAQHDAHDLAYPLAAHGIRMGYVPPTVVASMRKAQEEDSRRVVARALAICKEKQVDATAAVVEGDAKEAICQAAEEMRAGLLVLGSRGLGRIKRAFLGSVSDYLVHQASCPVLVVKPPKAHAN